MAGIARLMVTAFQGHFYMAESLNSVWPQGAKKRFTFGKKWACCWS